VWKFGRKNYKPIQFCLILDTIAIFASLYRLNKASSMEFKQSRGLKSSKQQRLRSFEKAELQKRIKDMLLKYLIRDPIYENFTKKLLEKVFSALRISPKLLALLLSLLNYFRYYAYIA